MDLFNQVVVFTYVNVSDLRLEEEMPGPFATLLPAAFVTCVPGMYFLRVWSCLLFFTDQCVSIDITQTIHDAMGLQ